MNTQTRLRAATLRLRTSSLLLADMIPLMQEAADELDALINENSLLKSEVLTLSCQPHAAAIGHFIKESPRQEAFREFIKNKG